MFHVRSSIAIGWPTPVVSERYIISQIHTLVHNCRTTARCSNSGTHPRQAVSVQVKAFVHTHIQDRNALHSRTTMAHTRTFQTSQNTPNKITDKLGEAGRKLIGILFPPPPKSVPSRMLRRSAERLAARDKAPRTDKAFTDYQKLKQSDTQAQTQTQSQSQTHYSKPIIAYSKEMQTYESGIVNRAEGRVRRTGRYVSGTPLVRFAASFDDVRRNYLEEQLLAASSSRVCLDHFVDNWNEYYGDNLATVLDKCAQDYLDAENAPATPMIDRPHVVTGSAAENAAAATNDLQIRPKAPTAQELALEALQKHSAWPILLKRVSQKVDDCSVTSFQVIIQSLCALDTDPGEAVQTAIMRRIDTGSTPTELSNVLYQILARGSGDLGLVEEFASYLKQSPRMVQDMSSVDVDILCHCVWMLQTQDVPAESFYNAFFMHMDHMIALRKSLDHLTTDSIWQLAATINGRSRKRRTKNDVWFINYIARASRERLHELSGSGIIALAELVYNQGRIDFARTGQAKDTTKSVKARRLGFKALSTNCSAFVVDAIHECATRGAQAISVVDLKTTLSVLRLAPYCVANIKNESLALLSTASQKDLTLCSAKEIVDVVNGYVGIEQAFNQSASCLQLYQKVGQEVMDRINGRTAGENTFGTAGQSVNDIAIRDANASILSDISMLVGVLHAYARAGYVLSPLFAQSIPIINSSLDVIKPIEAMHALYAFASARSLTPELATALLRKAPIDSLSPTPSTAHSHSHKTTKPPAQNAVDMRSTNQSARKINIPMYEALSDAAWGVSVTSKCREQPVLEEWVTRCLAILADGDVSVQRKRVQAPAYRRVLQTYMALDPSNTGGNNQVGIFTGEGTQSQRRLREYAEQRTLEYESNQVSDKQTVVGDLSEALESLGVTHKVGKLYQHSLRGDNKGVGMENSIDSTGAASKKGSEEATATKSDISKCDAGLLIDCIIPGKQIAFQVITDCECVLAETGRGNEGIDTRGLDENGIRILRLETEMSLQVIEKSGWTVMPLFTSDWRGLRSKKEKAVLVAHLLGKDRGGSTGLA
ncbi:hypothetical protein SARC_10263 [Sphaeroforma arctica JP610]|uniref:RAP domain-containing protein n=1 Tax=Sphaeroforma arctica JP610 TaxID=667725 RepID=A0A0L0FML5_9EUKA|nr:hypothetical protein SARC_10263 [Sphaeroforma arctica JP610]KNC77273.1 hypothetical protein SARC_10263 [Sphaeroforma arctica JP610]|eukprot:XP_014151175.1 hypothetical protein SARC_10263 [Sphaeroforma arctica JP610]